MDEIVVGLIGCGNIGRTHAGILTSLDGVRVACFCDANLDAAESLREGAGGAYATDDPSQVLEDAEISVVYISTHHDSHVPLSIEAIEKGKVVFLEKPMAIDLDSALRLARFVEQKKGRMMMGFKLRFEPLVDRARRAVPEPLITIGQLLDPPWPEDAWFMDPAAGGGNLLSQGCHMIDLVCHLNPTEPVRIHAEGGNLQHPSLDLYDTLAASIRFAGGPVATVAIGDDGPTPYVSKFSVQAAGNGKSAHLHHRLTHGTFFDGEKVREEQVGAELGFANENAAFIDSLRKDGPLPCDQRDGLRAALLLDRAYESIQTGSARDVPTLEELFAPKLWVKAGAPTVRLGIVGGLNASHSKAFCAILNGLEAGKSFPEGYPGLRHEAMNARVAAVADPDREASGLLAGTFGLDETFTDPEELIGKVDGVLVCDDRSMEHAAKAEVFLRAGVPTFIDKPLGKDSAPAEKIAGLVRETGTPCFSSSALRFARERDEAAEAMEGLGEVKMVSLTCPGELVGYGIHVAEVAVSLLGTEIESVSNQGQGPHNIVHARYRNGTDLLLQISEEYAHSFDLYMKGTGGTFQTRIADAQYFYSAMLGAFVEMVRTGKPPVPLDETLVVIRLLDLAGKSKREGGGWIEFPEG
jgi:predicted dehydrogenase